MPLIECPDCHKDLSTDAYVCPNCGRPTARQADFQKKAFKWILIWVAVMVTLLTVWSLLARA